jgi:hypothetical protein
MSGRVIDAQYPLHLIAPGARRIPALLEEPCPVDKVVDLNA